MNVQREIEKSNLIGPRLGFGQVRSLRDRGIMRKKIDAVERGLLILGQKGEARSSMRTRIQITFWEVTRSHQFSWLQGS